MLEPIAREALSSYDMPDDALLTPIRLMNNGVFEVSSDSGEQFVLRVHRPAYREVAHTRSELRFLEVLHERLKGTRVSVPRPVPARDGALVVEVAQRHCDLLTWLDGRVLRPARGVGPQGVHVLGEALGRIHNTAEQIELSELDLPRWDADGLFTAASPFRPGPLEEFLSVSDRRLFHEVEERTRAVFASLDRRGDAFGVIHCDFILLNCHFVRRASGWEVGVLDFDDLGWGYFLYDLCPLLGNLAEFPNYPAMRRSFLAGYRSVRSLPSDLEPTYRSSWPRGTPRRASGWRESSEHTAPARRSPSTSPTGWMRFATAWRFVSGRGVARRETGAARVSELQRRPTGRLR